ncbi:Lpg1974 family pore-forming outer membrane protein [Blastopirellula sp. J2-11]|uniref:Lpg1974 family pore-forming outer membrane protein n=1 Tax=Blastopirellula sp. J2-11 TaxID=2943192 RepID=UPI0021CAD251|nr:Lpg1974 family pore-forming outer membrane protein [Blastopirellula sp. J2-11]UUO06297.1 Lpg1974 family pore-forming outer membrane protein [Blastopirellula sp. J2-11]
MSFTRLLAVALLIGVSTPAAFAESTQSMKGARSNAQPQRLQQPAVARPLTAAPKRTARQQSVATIVTNDHVAPVSYHDTTSMPTETIYSPGDSRMMVGEAMSGCCAAECVPCGANWYAGFEATFLAPRFSQNPAYTLMQSDGASFESYQQVEFESKMAFAPRVFTGVQLNPNIGFQATWWQFSHDPASITAQPPANGFGQILPPPFGDVDVSTTIPGETFTASSGLTAYAIDLELTKKGCFSCWNFGVAGGVRYAEINQSYLSQTTDAAGTLSGQIDYQHGISGFGPTLSMFASVPVAPCWSLFTRGRGSLLFGDAHSNLNAGEDLDLTTPFTTTSTSNRDDLLSIGELQLGLQWRGGQSCRIWKPFATVAMEGQFWNGVGNAVSEEGNVGFFGVVTSIGVNW